MFISLDIIPSEKVFQVYFGCPNAKPQDVFGCLGFLCGDFCYHRKGSNLTEPERIIRTPRSLRKGDPRKMSEKPEKFRFRNDGIVIYPDMFFKMGGEKQEKRHPITDSANGEPFYFGD